VTAGTRRQRRPDATFVRSLMPGPRLHHPTARLRQASAPRSPAPHETISPDGAGHAAAAGQSPCSGRSWRDHARNRHRWPAQPPLQSVRNRPESPSGGSDAGDRRRLHRPCRPWRPPACPARTPDGHSQLVHRAPSRAVCYAPNGRTACAADRALVPLSGCSRREPGDRMHYAVRTLDPALPPRRGRTLSRQISDARVSGSSSGLVG
jgi:hypothetical protein